MHRHTVGDTKLLAPSTCGCEYNTSSLSETMNPNIWSSVLSGGESKTVVVTRTFRIDRWGRTGVKFVQVRWQGRAE